MARLPRLSVGGVPHLLVQTGLAGQPVFRDVDDLTLFRRLLGDATRAESMALHAYGLMDSELRLLITPPDGTSLSRLMQTLGRRYGAAFNRRHGRRGTLWEGRFRATLIEAERYLLPAMQFVEGVASDDGMVPPDGVSATPTSSLAHHVGAWRDPLITEHLTFWGLGNTPFERDLAYRQRVLEGLAPKLQHELADAVHKGWPLGSASFLGAMASQTPRRIVPLKRGRPPKSRMNLSPINRE